MTLYTIFLIIIIGIIALIITLNKNKRLRDQISRLSRGKEGLIGFIFSMAAIIIPILFFIFQLKFAPRQGGWLDFSELIYLFNSFWVYIILLFITLGMCITAIKGQKYRKLAILGIIVSFLPLIASAVFILSTMFVFRS